MEKREEALVVVSPPSPPLDTQNTMGLDAPALISEDSHPVRNVNYARELRLSRSISRYGRACSSPIASVALMIPACTDVNGQSGDKEAHMFVMMRQRASHSASPRKLASRRCSAQRGARSFHIYRAIE